MKTTVRPSFEARLHPPEALLLEGEVADGEDLVDDQDLGLQVGGHRERQPELHAARVALHGRVDEGADVRELDDLLEAALDLAALHVEDRAVQEDVLAAGELGMEARAHLEQRSDPAAQPRLAPRRRRDPGEDLEQRALAGAVVADHAEGLAALHLEVDVPQRPELLRLRAPAERLDPLGEPLGEQQVAGLVAADLVALAEVVDLDGDVVACSYDVREEAARPAGSRGPPRPGGGRRSRSRSGPCRRSAPAGRAAPSASRRALWPSGLT